MISFSFDELIIEDIINYSDLYSRYDIYYKYDLSLHKDKIDDNLFELFSSYDNDYIFNNVEYDKNNLLISYFNSDKNNVFSILFNDLTVIDGDIDVLLYRIKIGKINLNNIRIIDIDNDVFLIGFLLFKTCEFKIRCSNIIYK